MKTLLPLFILLLGVSPAVLCREWHTTGGAWKGALAHLRVEARQGESFGLRIANGDSTSWRSIRVELPRSGADDIFCLNEARLVFLSGSDGCDETVDSTLRLPYTSYATKNPQLSIKLAADRFGATVSIGETTAFYNLPLTLDNEKPLHVSPFASAKAKTVRDSFSYEPFTPIEDGRFTDPESLNAYISESSDAAEGIWKFYDRSFAPLRVADAGRYTLATIRDTNANADGNAYHIVYLGSDDNVPTRLKPFQVKGRLEDSGFTQIFNLDWRDADGTPVGWHASATIEGDLLTLRFPYWDIVMRFVRTR